MSRTKHAPRVVAHHDLRAPDFSRGLLLSLSRSLALPLMPDARYLLQYAFRSLAGGIFN